MIWRSKKERYSDIWDPPARERQPLSKMCIRDRSVSISERMLQYTTQLEGITALIVIPVILYMFHRDRKNEKMAGVIPNRKAPLWKYGAVIGIAAALCVGLNNLILISNISSYSAAYQQTSDSLYSAPFVMQLLCLGILVPISEELVFRGMMFKRMREQSGFGQAAFLSSLVFAILHGNMVQMLYALSLIHISDPFPAMVSRAMYTGVSGVRIWFSPRMIDRKSVV